MYACGSNKFGQLAVEDDDADEEEDGGKGEDETPMDEAEDISAFMSKDLKKRAASLKKRKDFYEPVLSRMAVVLNSATKRVTQIAVGATHAVAIVEDGSLVYSWGKNTEG